MLTETRFEENRDLIIVPAALTGRRATIKIRLAVDTASSSTILVPEAMDLVGYSARDGEALMAVSSPIGREYGYRLRVQRFAALGIAFDDFPISVLDIATGHDFDGLLGLSFLHLLDYEVQSSRGRILARPTAVISQA